MYWKAAEIRIMPMSPATNDRGAEGRERGYRPKTMRKNNGSKYAMSWTKSSCD